MNADPVVMEHFPSTLTVRDSRAFARRIDHEFEQRGYGLWAVEEPGVVEFAGFVGLHHHDFPAHFTPCVEVGWRLARQHWGRPRKGCRTKNRRSP